MLGSKEAIERVLRALAERLDLARTKAFELAICGGAALHVLGLMSRGVTRDVDAFALVQRRGTRLKLIKPDPLPDELLREAAVVAQDFGLPATWLNSEPSGLLDFGLPEGLERRLHAVTYGERLTLHFLDRWDQVHFKLYAAANYGEPGSRHVADLIALKPTEEELESAAEWSRRQDPSPGFLEILKSCLRHIGHEDLADGL